VGKLGEVSGGEREEPLRGGGGGSMERKGGLGERWVGGGKKRLE